jgi:hypothetical protein
MDRRQARRFFRTFRSLAGRQARQQLSQTRRQLRHGPSSCFALTPRTGWPRWARDVRRVGAVSLTLMARADLVRSFSSLELTRRVVHASIGPRIHRPSIM